MDNLVRIEKSQIGLDVNCYEIFGLNLFLDAKEDLQDIQYTPFVKFIERISSPYDTICLIGSLSIKDNIGELGIEEFLGTQYIYHKTPISFYNGGFYNGLDYDNPLSTLLKIDKKQLLLTQIIETFMVDDAVAFFLFEKGKNALDILKNALKDFTDEKSFINAVLENSKIVVVSGGDLQCLEIYTKDNKGESTLRGHCNEVITYIVETEWYQSNKNNLQWDDEEQCYSNKQ